MRVIDSSASMHSFMGGGKGKKYMLTKQAIHDNIRNKEQTVIVKCFVKDIVCL